MAQKTNVSGLSYANNFYIKGLNQPNWQETLLMRDLGMNKVSELIMKMNNGKSEGIYGFKTNVSSIGSTSISNTVSGVSVLSGGNLVVTLTNPENRIRKGDTVKDGNLVGGLVVDFTSTTITIEPQSTTSWNPSVHFTNGMNVADMGNVSANGRTTGITSLSVTPDTDFALLRKTRDTDEIDLLDKTKTFVKYYGKEWYTSHIEWLLQRYNRLFEYQVIFDERLENVASSRGEYNMTGGVRWTAQKNGGLYRPMLNDWTQSDLDDFLTEFIAKNAQPVKNIKVYCGRQALKSLQVILRPFVLTAGDRNVVGGSAVVGSDIYDYAIAGLRVRFEHYPLFDNPLFAGQVSSITGKSLMSSTIMIIDAAMCESANGKGMVAPIQQFHHAGLSNGRPVTFKRQRGMMDEEGDSATSESNFGESATDIDVSTYNIESVRGIYVNPDNVAWGQLVN